jgi:tetratricopeptide (TPR) repeat protein
MKKKMFSFLVVILLLSYLAVISGCSTDKYSQFKGKDYEDAWKQLNDFVLKHKGKRMSFDDIKKDYLLKAVLFELVRRAENPGKKSSVDTMSKSEEEQVITAWERVINETQQNLSFFEAFSDNLEKGALLLHDSGVEKNEAYNIVAHYLFYELKKFDQAIAMNERGGMSTKEACKLIFRPFEVSGSGGYGYYMGHEEKMIDFLQKAGKTREEASFFVADGVAYHYASQVRDKEPSEEEALKKLKEEGEKEVLKYAGNEKAVAQIIGKAFLHAYLPFQAVEYLEKAGDKELLKEAYHEMAKEYFYKEDFKNALIYYEKAEAKEDLEELRNYLKKLGKVE